MMRLVKLHLLLLSVIMTSCVDPFDAPRGNYDELLVVEAFISASNQPQSVYLSFSYPIDTSAHIPVNGAIVRIDDNLGNSHELQNSEPGTYITDPQSFIPEFGRTYQLTVDLGTGRKYTSEKVSLRPTPPISNVYYEITKFIDSEGNITDGLDIKVNTEGTPGETAYYMYEWEESYKTVPPFPSFYEYDRENGFIVLREDQISECWLNNNSTSIILATTEGLSTSDIQGQPVHTLSFNSSELHQRYSILVKQMALDKKAYEFWKNLQVTNETEGSLFDTQPFPLTGNIYNMENTREPVLGYFDMSDVASSRIFIDHSDIPEEYTAPSLFDACIRNPGDILVVSDSVWFYDLKDYLISSNVSHVGFIMVPRPCIDCRLKGSNVPPEFWVE